MSVRCTIIRFFSIVAGSGILLAACGPVEPREHQLVLTSGHVYSLSWSNPGIDGHPAEDAPFENGIWYPDAEAIYIAGDRIIYVGTNEGALAQAGPSAEVVNLAGAVVIPGAVESHGHIHELGEHFEQLDLTLIATKKAVIELVAERVREVPPGEWIIGWGWDEGAWADNLPNWSALNRKTPDNPVVLKGRRGFGAWANRLAFAEAGIDERSSSPYGGEFVRDEANRLTGILLNNAVDVLYDAIPEPTLEKRIRILSYGLDKLAASGYVSVYHAGVRSDYMPAYRELSRTSTLPIRVHLMLAAVKDNQALLDEHRESGPTRNAEDFLQIRGVKAYYDGSLGSRGARLLEDYSDLPGHRGIGAEEYGFDETLVERMMLAGFQVGIHAIGDEANRAVLDFYEDVFERHPQTRMLRHRIEHAQVVHADDFPRFGELGIVASMQPGHAIEDSPWAENRLGQSRIVGAYAWRTLLKSGATIIFNSDYSGTDHSLFYGLYAAISRSNREGRPAVGWYPEQRLTPEEALRAYTSWPAFAAGIEDMTGTIEPGKWADLTVLSVDPLNVVLPGQDGIGIPVRELLDGRIEMTIVGGNFAFRR